MKIYKILSGAFLALFTLNGCSDFLEVDKIGQTTIPVLFSDVEGIRAARVGAYKVMLDFYNGELPVYPEVAGDLAAMPTVSSSFLLSQYNFQSTPEDASAAVGHIWKSGYEAMANLNYILQYQPEILEKFPANAAELKRIKAEMLFLRALCHFELCRVYAQPYNYTPAASHPGIPVLARTPKAEEAVGRSSVGKVYEQIVTDLENSIGDFGSTTTAAIDAYHASKVASQALLCRVSLYQGNWEKTVAMADSVLKVVPIAYGDDYLNMYNANMTGKEAIFRLRMIISSQQNPTLPKYYNADPPTIYASDSLVSLYEAQDIRLSLFSKNKSINQSLKYTLPSTLPDAEKHYDPFVLRASEILLNRAEAYLNLNQPDKAADDLKALIARNMKKDVSEIILPSSVESLWPVLRKERAKELCFEGHQFYDLTRWKKDIIRPANTSSLVKRINYPSDRFVLPIPLAEIQANPEMKGNPTVNK